MSNEKKTVPVLSVKQLIKTDSDIQLAIAKAQKAGNTVQLDYQRIACSMLVRLAETKDIRPVVAMIEGMPEAFRKKPMKEFFAAFGNVRIGDTEEDAGKLYYCGKKKLQLGHALEKAWWTMSKESAYVPFNFETEVQKLIDRATKRMEKGISVEKGDNLTHSQINALRNVISKPVVLEEMKKAAAKASKPRKARKAA